MKKILITGVAGFIGYHLAEKLLNNKDRLKKEDIKGLFIHSNVKNENNLVTSSDLLNLIQEAVERTFLSNLVSVQSDCPAREKFGYGGDINGTGGTGFTSANDPYSQWFNNFVPLYNGRTPNGINGAKAKPVPAAPINLRKSLRDRPSDFLVSASDIQLEYSTKWI